MKKAELSTIYRCNFCGEGFMRLKAKENHEIKIHVQMTSTKLKDDQEHSIFHCRKCGKPFENLKAVEIHEKLH